MRPQLAISTSQLSLEQPEPNSPVQLVPLPIGRLLRARRRRRRRLPRHQRHQRLDPSPPLLVSLLTLQAHQELNPSVELHEQLGKLQVLVHLAVAGYAPLLDLSFYRLGGVLLRFLGGGRG